ncbi:LacI family DNA-binding transcriptional regulator [Dactylosporangium sucinum]|uniref:LacI family transcriptional regulator n=1 Tax=Dactylosporangium sucinum TaxID=1424081 RepID=A0A917T991_9ACTN|nr:LacI family DNA-binding transcriptional regulator [Dactylosporangium sucinum]GGM15162.1 LacI family transcriptional regulator [Dactylosporangium sucinum]
MAVTIADVAKHAGVSRSTVSYVLSGNRSISAETIAKVERSIEELQFRPHAGARSIRTRRTGVIAMVLPLVHGPHNQVQMPYVWAALTAAQDAGLKLLMLTDDDGTTAIRDAVGTALVDGVMLMEVQQKDPRAKLLRSLKCPAVLVGTPDNPHGLPYVDFDFAACGRICAEHLLEQGHTHVGFLGQPADTYERGVAYAAHARDGALNALAEQGAQATWSPCEPSAGGVVGALTDLLERDPAITGLIVYNEWALPLVVDGLTSMGRGDLAVIAICPDDAVDRLSRPVTSVALPVEELARISVQRLAGLINGAPQPSVTMLAPVLKVR